MAGMVIILLLGWGIISFSDNLWSAYSTYKSDSTKIVKSGHWGDIVIRDVLLDLPDEFVMLPSDSKDNQWFFEGYTWAMVIDLLKSAQLSDQALHDWITTTPRRHDTDGIRLMPTDQQILDLSPESRSILYPILTGMSANSDVKDVICFKKEILNQQLKDSGLSRSSLDLLNRLLYRNPSSPLLIFSDWDVALRQIASNAEKRLFVKTLSRKPSLLAEIRVTPDSNIDQLVNYWGVGGRRKDIEPLLASIKSLKTNVDLSLVCLLPPFVRDRVYSYPFPSSDGTGIKQDCFWTAFNTFNLTPDDNLSEMDYIAHKLEHEYYKIYEPSQLGDIICLSVGEKKVIHAAIFITTDIVFTKNGYDFTQPWILMRKSDMLEIYKARYPASTLQPIFFRKRTI